MGSFLKLFFILNFLGASVVDAKMCGDILSIKGAESKKIKIVDSYLEKEKINIVSVDKKGTQRVWTLNPSKSATVVVDSYIDKEGRDNLSLNFRMVSISTSGKKNKKSLRISDDLNGRISSSVDASLKSIILKKDRILTGRKLKLSTEDLQELLKLLTEQSEKASLEAWYNKMTALKPGFEDAVKKNEGLGKYSYLNNSPKEWVESMLNKVDDFVQGNSKAEPLSWFGRKVRIKPLKRSLIEELYESEIVSDSWMMYILSDKLLVAKTIKRYLGKEKAENYHPNSVGVKEFLLNEKLIDAKTGKVTSSKEEIQDALERFFPNGVVAKPTQDALSDGVGIFFETSKIAEMLSREDSKIYEAQELKNPFYAEKFNMKHVVSGERMFFMGKASLKDPSGGFVKGFKKEYRVHSIGNKVVEGATYNRWDNKGSDKDIVASEKMISNFLADMPLGFSKGQAYSYDVLVRPDGSVRMIEMNTNAGTKKRGWSGYMIFPQTLQAYVRHLEKVYKWNFMGLSGHMFRTGSANARTSFLMEVYWSLKIDAKEGRISEKDILNNVMSLKDHAKRLKILKAKGLGHKENVIEEMHILISEYSAIVNRINKVGDAEWSKLDKWFDAKAESFKLFE